jgi:hypothetical protein
MPLDPEAATLQEYLAALAEGRYAEAAGLLDDPALEHERRSDLRPLFTEFGDAHDLPARLQAWCETAALCTVPDAAPVDIGNFWVATWSTAGGPLTGYFRSGSFEGTAVVHGLPPRRPAGSVVACPQTGVTGVREADVDGDGTPETLVVTGQAPDHVLEICNSASAIPPTPFPATTPVIGVLDPASDPAAVVVLGDVGEAGVCGATYRMAQSAGALVEVGWNGCWGADATESIGCRQIDGQDLAVAYRYSYVGGDRLDNSTSLDVEVTTLDGMPLDAVTLVLPDQIDEALALVEPSCSGLPVVGDG